MILNAENPFTCGNFWAAELPRNSHREPSDAIMRDSPPGKNTQARTLAADRADEPSISIEWELRSKAVVGGTFPGGEPTPFFRRLEDSMSRTVPSVSGTEEHEPEHAKDQDRETGGRHKESEHRWPRLGLPRLGRGFDDLTLLSRCHAGLDSLMSRQNVRARYRGNALFQMMFRALPQSHAASHEQGCGPSATPACGRLDCDQSTGTSRHG